MIGFIISAVLSGVFYLAPISPTVIQRSQVRISPDFFIILEVYMSVVQQITDQEVENCYFLFLNSLICGVDVE